MPTSSRIVSTIWLTPSTAGLYTQGVVASFRHKGLEDLYQTGKTRRIGTENLGKCMRILQLLDVATLPEDMNIAGHRFHIVCTPVPNVGLCESPATIASPSPGRATTPKTSILKIIIEPIET